MAMLTLLPTAWAAAAEIDSWTERYLSRPDALPRLNELFRGRLEEGIRSANEAQEGCDPDGLYKALRRSLGGAFFLVGHSIASQLREDRELPRSMTRLQQSVYRDLPVLSGVSMQLADLMPTVRAAGHEVGLDKFGHFFAQGWAYFEMADLDGEGLAEALAWGGSTERWKYGLLTTGIYSYADLVANFNGLRFWRRVLGRQGDPLGAGGQPYVSCEDGQWVGEAQLDLVEYLDAGWDEGNNCPRLSSEANTHRHQWRLWQLQARHLRRFQCPIDPPACRALVDKYGSHSESLLSPPCLNARETLLQRTERRFRTLLGLFWGPALDSAWSLWHWFGEQPAVEAS